MNGDGEPWEAMPDPKRRIIDAIDIALNRDFYGNRDPDRAFDALEEIRSIVDSLPEIGSCVYCEFREACDEDD